MTVVIFPSADRFTVLVRGFTFSEGVCFRRFATIEDACELRREIQSGAVELSPLTIHPRDL